MYYIEFTASVKKKMDHSYTFHLVSKHGSSRKQVVSSWDLFPRHTSEAHILFFSTLAAWQNPG